MDPVAHVQWSLSDRVLPVVGSVRVIVYMSCGPRSFMQDAAMVVESSLARSCNHLQPKYGCAHMVFSLRASSPFVFTLDGSLTLHRGCRMPIGSLVLALLQHLNYPGCAVTTCDLNRYWGYLGLLGLDGCTKAGEGKGDRLTMIDRCLKWPAAGRCSSQMFSIKREFYRMWRRYLHKTL